MICPGRVFVAVFSAMLVLSQPMAAADVPSASPMAVEDSYLRGTGGVLSVAAPGVLSNERDPGGAPLTAAVVRPPSHGTVALKPDGSFTYSANDPASTTPDEFAYKSSNGTTESSVAVVRIAVADAPTIADAEGCTPGLASAATYTPFLLKCATGVFDNIWNSERGDTPITFYQSNGALGPYLPLGDIAVVGQSLAGATPPPGTQLLFAPPPDDPGLLQHPAGFGWILDDIHSGNERNIDYYALIPPDGYVALGIAFTSGGSPVRENYWCIRKSSVQSVGATVVWIDSGSHWTDYSGNLSVPVTTQVAPAPYVLFAPPTFLSARAGTPAYAVVMEQAAGLEFLGEERPHRRPHGRIPAGEPFVDRVP